ncbi:hypothetical protein BGW36DRAFT_362854 [Talaromyces proteolyticus]|uniref:F-box domain-containing protein n=1 Tax=Talaromyces proteolyticus TaxID=1131652 RepID=A0AAD4KMB3_9EURO|nr:uncharacterized protein BGW36DRAFT_362854 [Talaromyces proteolyticus]KAH8691817.1 hypothetical protein BGW36DRAFT_362854 [Talaromyces proteolyticus]
MGPKNLISEDFVPSPLTLDRVMEGRPAPTQDNHFLKLPVEIRSLIIRYIDTDKTSLAALALVNWDCRQLARSCQFRDVVIDYSPRSSCVLGILIGEAAERLRSGNGLTRRPSLGACIRSIRTNSNQYWKEIRNMRPGDDDGNVDDNDRDDTASTNQWKQSVGNMTTRINHVYNPSFSLVISTLPHLEALCWENGSTIDCHLFNCLAVSAIKHLKLHGSIESEYVTVPLDGDPWQLESLDIDITWDFGFHYGRNIADSSCLWSSLFSACCSSLRYLKLSHRHFLNSQDKRMSFTANFPNLRFLQIETGTMVSQLTLQSLLRSKRLSTLVVDFDDSITRECLDQMGYHESIQYLVWNSCTIRQMVSLQVLDHNNQLTGFAIRYSQSTALLDRILPVLASFPNLRVLSMRWNGMMIPKSSLIALSSLTNLEQLHISSGNQTGWKHNWLVDHDATQSILFPLRRLKKIAIT